MFNSLEETSGIIEYIDPEESNTSLIAVNPWDILNKEKYEFCEINPCLILGALANNVSFIDNSATARNLYATAHMKQALGIYASNYINRFEVKGVVLNYPQKPLIKTRISKYLFSDQLPHGINAIVAICCFQVIIKKIVLYLI